jgi:hypothetical protein
MRAEGFCGMSVTFTLVALTISNPSKPLRTARSPMKINNAKRNEQIVKCFFLKRLQLFSSLHVAKKNHTTYYTYFTNNTLFPVSSRPIAVPKSR